MTPIRLILGRNTHWISIWVRLKTWSEWSHVAIVDGDVVIEAKGIAVWPMLLVLLNIIPNSIELGGVVRTPISDFLDRYDSVHYVWIDGDMDRARSLVGTPFDPWGMLGILIKRNIHCVRSLFCAEYVALVATHFRDEFAHHQTAQTILAASRDTERVPWDAAPLGTC